MILHYPDAAAAPIANVSPLGYRFWRVRWLSTFANTYAVAAEIEFRQVVGVAEQATGGVASASTIFNTSGAFDASQAFDNNPATVWNSSLVGGVPAQWIQYAFATPKIPLQLKLQAGSSGGTHAPTQFVVEYSGDGVTWNTKYTSAAITWTSSEVKLFTL